MVKVNTAFDHIEKKESIQELSVVLYSDSFFYGLWDDQNILLRSGSHSLDELPEFLNDSKTNYFPEMVRFMHTSPPYIHIPSEEFAGKDFKKYFKYIYPLRKLAGRKKASDHFVNEDIYTLYFIDKSIRKEQNQNELKVKNGHISTALANYAFLSDIEFVSYISNDVLHISYSKNGAFSFYNQFKCYHKEDFIYFYMLSLQALELDPAEMKITLGGNIDEDSPLFRILNAYLPDLQLKEDSLQAESVFPKHYYFDLYLCKSCV